MVVVVVLVVITFLGGGLSHVLALGDADLRPDQDLPGTPRGQRGALARHGHGRALAWQEAKQKKSKHARRFEDGSKTGAQFDHVAKNLWVGELQDTV